MRVGHQLAACVQADTSSDQRISIEELLLGYLCKYLGRRGGKAEAFLKQEFRAALPQLRARLPGDLGDPEAAFSEVDADGGGGDAVSCIRDMSFLSEQ